MTSEVKVNDYGLSGRLGSILALDGSEVIVGVLDGHAGTYPDANLSAAQIAAVNEFGSRDGHVPERSFMRSTMDEERVELGRNLAKVVAAIASGRMTESRALNLIGMDAQRRIQRKIVALREPPNAPSTIARKGSSNPLVDTGRLTQSITYAVEVSLDRADGVDGVVEAFLIGGE